MLWLNPRDNPAARLLLPDSARRRRWEDRPDEQRLHRIVRKGGPRLARRRTPLRVPWSDSATGRLHGAAAKLRWPHPPSSCAVPGHDRPMSADGGCGHRPIAAGRMPLTRRYGAGSTLVDGSCPGRFGGNRDEGSCG
jgi:hypothetical protein